MARWFWSGLLLSLKLMIRRYYFSKLILKRHDFVYLYFFNDMLMKIGFGPKLRGWIQGCLNSSMESVMINGSSIDVLHFRRGVGKVTLFQCFSLLLWWKPCCHAWGSFQSCLVITFFFLWIMRCLQVSGLPRTSKYFHDSPLLLLAFG